MNRTLASASLVSLAALAILSGCRGDDDGGVTTDAPPADDVRIQDIQAEAMPVETSVALRGVVVVAIDGYGDRANNFYVMEPGGGEWSGVMVFGATMEQARSLTVGDLVDVTGVKKDEYSQSNDDGTITELVPQSMGSLAVTKVGTGTVPAPHVVDSLAFGRMSKVQREAEYEKWEGVLIRVENVSVTNSIRQIGAGGMNPDPTFRGFAVTGIYDVDSSLADIPNTPTPYVVRGDCLASVTGVGDYFYEYKVLPRATADIVKGGTGCPPEEMDATTCGDGTDNDADGFVDCMDFSCQQTVAACQTAATVVNIQNGTIPVNTNVTIADAIVTAVSSSNKNLWIADAAQGAPHNGVMVYRGSAADLPAEVIVGAHVMVSGRVDENNDDASGLTLTQLGLNPTVTVIAGTPAAPLPVTGLSIATLTTEQTAEPYEGVLVEIRNVRVTGTVDSFGVRAMGLMATDMLFVSDNDLSAALTEANGTCYDLIRGIWSYQVNQNKWAILPLGGATNTIVGGACP